MWGCNFSSTYREWLEELFRDNDVQALRLSEKLMKKQTEMTPKRSLCPLLDMGICSYSVSYSDGFDYALRAMDEFQEIRT